MVQYRTHTLEVANEPTCLTFERALQLAGALHIYLGRSPHG